MWKVSVQKCNFRKQQKQKPTNQKPLGLAAEQEKALLTS